MKNITDKKLLNLGFERVIITPEEANAPVGYYYFVYNVGDNKSLLITNTSDECPSSGCFYVEFFDVSEIGKFYDLKSVKKLVKLLKKAKV
jgi:hypothetical protein